MDVIQSATDLIIEVNKEKGIYTVYMRGYPECTLCYEAFNTAEYLDNLKTGKNFPHRNFVIDDIVGCLGDEGVKVVKNIVNILYIRTDIQNRNKGLATALLTLFLRQYYTDVEDNTMSSIVVFRVTPTHDDYPTEPTKEQYKEFFMRMRNYLMPFGFHSIQSLCGLEFGEPYIYLSQFSSPAKIAWLVITQHYYDNMEDK